MIRMLTIKSRRTPIIAILLAPIALYFLVVLWTHALVPLYRSVWYSDTMLQWRLSSGEPAVRIQAAKDAGMRDAAVVEDLVSLLETDDSVEVRKVAATALGQLGSRRLLDARATQALSTLVLSVTDPALLSVVVMAVGQSAAENRYQEAVVERIGEIAGERERPWAATQAINVLGRIGAAQELPNAVYTMMNTRFRDPQNAGEREDLANAFLEIARGGRLPVPTLDMLAAAFDGEPNRRVRQAILRALANAAEDYPAAITLGTAATGDPDADIASTAESGLRIIEYNRTLAGRDVVSVAANSSEPIETRLAALRVIRSTRIEPTARAPIVALARDSDTQVAVAAIEMFPSMVRSVESDFDRDTLIPALIQAMSAPDSLIRYAAYAALSGISRNRPAYLLASDMPAQLEAGANDPDPRVRVVVLVMMLRDDGERAATIERGFNDPDPYVRSNAVTWLALPETSTNQREEFLARAMDDPNPDVRRSAADTQQTWDTRNRAWPVELWQQWRAGERGEVGMSVLIAATVATPVLIGVSFFIYYMARLLTYLQQRRRRAAVLVPVMITWAVASYGMFLLYFVAALAGGTDAGETAILAGILWGAIVLYGALGWGMHFAVRK